MAGANPSRVLPALIVAVVCGASQAGELEALLDEYRATAGGPFDAPAGRQLWQQDFAGRSCTSCHGEDPRAAGRHATTGKRIEPMARSVNPERLQDAAKVRKWLYRNCKWTLGRECSAREKGDLLTWLHDL